MGTELKPCPFCGGVAEQDYRQHYLQFTSGHLDHAAAIYCTNCNCQMSICRGDTRELTDEDRMNLLVENWNKRVEVTQ